MVVVVVLVSGAIAAVVMVVLARRRPAGDPMGTEGVEHWLVRWVDHRPRLRRMAARADRMTIGGAAVAATLVTLWLAGLLVGSIFETIGTNRGFARWDTSVANWGADHVSHGSLQALLFFTRFGSTSTVIAVLVGVGLIELAVRRSPAALGYLTTVGLGVVALNNVIKLLVGRDRPLVPHLTSAAGSSFPSGHSAAAAASWAAVALVVGQHLPRRARPWLAAAAGAVAVTVAASRALLGVHWLTDVLAGLVVGWTWFFLVTLIFGGRILRFGEPAERMRRRAHRARPAEPDEAEEAEKADEAGRAGAAAHRATRARGERSTT